MHESHRSIDWLEELLRSEEDDPWGHNFKGTEVYRHRQIIRMLEKSTRGRGWRGDELRAIDVGCALGHFTRYLYEYNPNLIAIDISRTAIDKARVRFGHIDFRAGALPEMDLPACSFDLITCLEVLYYMNDDEKRVFLSVMNRLLTDKGVAVITSVIGERPYYKPRDLIELLSEHFEVKAVQYYGSRLYGRFDELLFGIYKQCGKIQGWLALDREELREMLSSGSSHKRRRALGVMMLITRFRNLKILAYILLRISRSATRAYLSSTLPAKLFHFIAQKFYLRPTHTFVLVGKRR